MNLLREASDAGDRAAKTQLALIYLSGGHGKRDTPAAEGLLLEAAQGGNADASLHLGHLYAGLFDPELMRPNEAVKFYLMAAEGGNAAAQHQVAALMSGEKATEEQLGEAVKWYSRAAERGYAPSQFQLGVMHCTGRGVVVNLEEAVRWYERAAEGGHKLAMYNLGVMLARGMGVEADPSRGEAMIRASGIQPGGGSGAAA
jgi:TPR repeat protein